MGDGGLECSAGRRGRPVVVFPPLFLRYDNHVVLYAWLQMHVSSRVGSGASSIGANLNGSPVQNIYRLNGLK